MAFGTSLILAGQYFENYPDSKSATIFVVNFNIHVNMFFIQSEANIFKNFKLIWTENYLEMKQIFYNFKMTKAKHSYGRATPISIYGPTIATA